MTSNAEEAEVERFYEDLQDILEPTPKKDVFFIIGDWNAKVGSQEIPGIRGKFGLGVQDEVNGLTHVVWCVTRSGQRVVTGGFLGKAKISELENGVGPFGGV